MEVAERKAGLMATDNRQENSWQEDDRQENQSSSGHRQEDSTHAVQPSGPKGDNPATAGPGPTRVQSGTPENRQGHINPSAPEDVNTTPGTGSEK
jgi:hypothetical protein